MDLSFSEEQIQLREMVRKLLEEVSDEAAVRELMAQEAGFDTRVWTRLAEEVGLVGLTIPEEQGGAGLGAVELAIVLEEMGAALLCAPFFSTAVLATTALLESDDAEARAELLPRIAAGKCRATLALGEPNAEPGADWELASVSTHARREGTDYALSGIKTPVVDGASADVILVCARSDAGLTLFHVEADSRGLTRRALPPLDPTRKLARLELADTPARRIGTEGGAESVLRRVLDFACTALAAEQAGGAQRCLDMSVDYAKSRLQFGRPIGSFQAIKHKCADLLVDVECAKSAAYYAAFCAVERPTELPVAASMAQATCSEAYFRAACENIQIHGGIGFTWEHPAHLYLKRAKSSALLLGDALYHRDRLARSLDL